MQMKVVYIHFHLKTGGVTTVLKQQVDAVKNHIDALVITGVPPASPFPAETSIVPGLGYDTGRSQCDTPETVAAAVIETVYAKWKNGCDLIHVHNPTLAKNTNLLKTLNLIRKKNIKLFLQIHDFAEDGRPSVYFEDDYVPDTHYGVINSRDYNILIKAGLKKEGLHKVPNMIHPWRPEKAEFIPAEMALYPIRALRRKNIGEAILLSLFFRNRELLAITLPPNSPLDIKSYLGWKEYAQKQNLRVQFDAGVGSEFESLVMSAKLLVTTSIMEGFGFSFLEPWIARKYLWGRRIADICQDFEDNGIRLSHLYDHLNIPLEWISKSGFFNRQFDCIEKNSRRFHFPIDKDKIRMNIHKLLSKNTIDFGLLDEQFQKMILDRIITRPADKKILEELNPCLINPTRVDDKNELIRHNMKAITKSYNEDVYRKNLLSIYKKAIYTPVRHHINKNVLLSHFFNLKTYSLLKWGDYVE